MTEQPVLPGDEPLPPVARAGVLVAVVLVGVFVDLAGLLLLPTRIAGALVPLGALVAFAGNVAVVVTARQLVRGRAPSYLLLVVGSVVSGLGATTGPGGDVLVPTNLLWPYVLYVVAALGGAAVGLSRRFR